MPCRLSFTYRTLRSWRGRPCSKRRTSEASGGQPRAPCLPHPGVGRPLRTQRAFLPTASASRGRDRRRSGPAPIGRMGAPEVTPRSRSCGCLKACPSVALHPFCPARRPSPGITALCPDPPGRPQCSPLTKPIRPAPQARSALPASTAVFPWPGMFSSFAPFQLGEQESNP